MKKGSAESREPKVESRFSRAVLWVLLLSAAPLRGQDIITTVAGSTWVFRGDGGPATSAPLGNMQGVAVDAAGNVYACDEANNLVVKISASGILTTVAGNGMAGFSGDGGPATSASLRHPYGVAVDAAGSLYIADFGNHRIRKVSTFGIISTVAGDGTQGFSGDGGPATSASFSEPEAVAVDAAGNLYIADRLNNRVRKVNPSGIISTVAGSGAEGFSGDGGPATSASLYRPEGVAVDAAGSLYIADAFNARIRKVSPSGIISTVAGNGAQRFSGDGGSATSASLYFPHGVAVDAAGNLYITDHVNKRIRRVSPSGILTTVAGGGSGLGDGGPATSASLWAPIGVAVDPAGNLYIADYWNYRIRKVNPSGMISTVAGNGAYKFAGDGGPATSASFWQPYGVAVDAVGNLYVADRGNSRIRKVSPSGIISTVAGNGIGGYSGDGGPATSASLFDPRGVAVDAAGNLYVADSGNQRIRKVSPSGTISTAAGGGHSDPGDGGPATSAWLGWPEGVAVDAAGNLYIADVNSYRIRNVSPSGIINTVAGNGAWGLSGDGGPATSAQVSQPRGVAVDAAGNLYIADFGNRRVRKVSPSGIISTAAGGGSGLGDGGPATSASLAWPSGVAVDAADNLYIADWGSSRIRRVSPSGIISTVAGGGSASPGDGGPATNAALGGTWGVAVDAVGNLFIADMSDDRIRKVLTTPPVFSVAPAALKFSAPSGTAAVGAQQVAVSGAVTGLAWSAQASTETGGSWLSISPAAGTMPTAIAVSVDASSLAAGTYRGTITVTAPLAAQPKQTVSVELTVTAAPKPQLALEPGSLTFEAQAGGDNPAAQTLRISNVGTGTLAWTAEWHSLQAVQWLSVSPASGSASAGSPASVQLKVTAGALAAGVYSGSIRVESSATGDAVIVPVTLLISRVTQTILVSQSGLLFTGVQGADSAPSQSFGILNTGQGVMNWTVRSETLSGGSWLRVSPSSGRSDASSLEVPLVEVSVSVAGLRAGQYSGLIRVEATGANNSPQYVSVDLTVLPPGSNPGVLVRPTGLIFAARAGTSSPGSQTVRLATAAPGSVGTVGGLLTYDGGNWLQALPTNLVLSPADPRNIVIQPGLGSLAAGIYRAALTLLFNDNSPCQSVNVLFLVVGAGARAASWSAGSETDGACAPGRLHAVHRTLGNSFSAPVSWPSPIEVQVMDDCGTAVANATVVASFTNGDPPLALTSLRNGTYMGTWRPVNTATQAVVTVRASLPPLTPVEIQARGAVGANAAAPALNSGGIVNGASFAPAAPLAPGSIISVFGANLAATSAGAASLPLPKTLAGASLQVGGLDVPLFYSSGGQVNAQLPFELALNARPQLIVKGASFVTVPETITVAAARPGIFTTTQDGKGQGVIMDVANRLVDSANPAKAGDVVVVYCTGLGATNPAVRSGEAAPAPPSPLAKVVMPVTVTIGGQPATVQFAGLTPGFAGLYQVNVQIPAGVTPATSVPLVISQDSVPSNTVTLAVR
jgi:uncharacterized protein (TIGR03437 family)